MSLGPIMLDIEGITLTQEDRELLCHPAVGAVILFSRNYASVEQLSALIAEIHALRDPHLLVAVDHEGGRVQRFRDGFTRLPAVRRIGELFDHDRRRAHKLAQMAGWVMASELRAVGIDFSFAPVLDLDMGVSSVIGDRAFHSDPIIIAELAGAYIAGMRRAGMAATGKHFPGHGAVSADSHEAVPVDERRFEAIFAQDIVPYEHLISTGLAAVMPAHVIYSQVDKRPAGFSSFWLSDVLRKRLGFQGVIFSDDLNMQGASVAGDYPGRAQQALSAGCDMALICNNRPAAWQIVRSLSIAPNPVRLARLARMHGQHRVRWPDLHKNPEWLKAVDVLKTMNDDPSLEFDF